MISHVIRLNHRRQSHVSCLMCVSQRVVCCQCQPNAKDHQVRTCIICLEDIKINDVVSWSKNINACNHVYHARCILPWLLHKSTCPICRCNYVNYPQTKFMSYFRHDKPVIKPDDVDKKGERDNLRFCVKHGLTHCCCDCCQNHPIHHSIIEDQTFSLYAHSINHIDFC